LVDSDDDSVAGQHGESARRSKNNSSSAGWISTNKESSQPRMRLKKRKDKTYATKKKLSKQGMLLDDYADDAEYREIESRRQSYQSSSATRRTRSKTRKAKNKDEVIEILDSSSEEESSDEEEVLSPKRNESNQFVEVSCDMLIGLVSFIHNFISTGIISFSSPAECNKASHPR
jgi:hypothetical protein